MKSSKNFLKFFCFILILTYIQSKYYNSKKILLQTKRAVAASNIINQSCYLKSKEKTEASGCFFDTAENLLNIIDKGPSLSKYSACIMIHLIVKADEGLKYIFFSNKFL